MCGFAGVIAWEDRFRVDRGTLGRWSARVAHRGPDGEGLRLDGEGREAAPGRPMVGLAHRRLAIIDPDPRADQPFTDGDGRWIVFNGEIYNYRALREELKRLRPEYSWRTEGDTEALLLAYAAWGEQCVDRLNGMFTFAVWDGPANRLFLARDRMGQKPLFRAIVPAGNRPRAIGACYFASELGVFDREGGLNERGLFQYLTYGYCHGGQTFERNVAEILPAQSETIGPESVHSQTFFQPNPASPIRIDDGAAVSETRRLVMSAVERQVVADVPIGCFLSGGVDSSIIAACMRRLGPCDTFSVGFDDPRYDESAYAAEVARHLGTRHHPLRVTPRAADDLPRIAAAYGQPFADSSALPTYYLSRETRRSVKVALGGDGGDELFGGYDRYRAMRLAGRLDALPGALRGAAGWMAEMLISPGEAKAPRTRLRRFAATLGEPPADRYDSYLRLFSPAQMAELLDRPVPPDRSTDAYDDDRAAAAAFRALAPGRSPVETALAVDRILYLPNDLLTKVDRASMIHALEVRSPFMDHDLVTFAAGLSTRQLLGGGPKRMLREAFAADLPAAVFRRRKMGFAVPIGDWLRGRLRPMLCDYLFASGSFAARRFHRPTLRRLVDEHQSRRADHAQRLYALLILELWWTARPTRHQAAAATGGAIVT